MRGSRVVRLLAAAIVLLVSVAVVSRVARQSGRHVLGACSTAHGHFSIDQDYFKANLVWETATAASLVSIATDGRGNGAVIALSGVQPLAASTPAITTVNASEVDYPDFLTASAQGMTLWFGIDPATSVLRVNAAVDSSQAVTFLGNCADHVTTEFRRFVSAAGAGKSQAEMLRSIATAGAAAAQLHAFENPPQPTPTARRLWSELPPDQRHLDGEDTPQAVKKTLTDVWVHMNFPASWMNKDFNICGRTAIAWSGCVAITGVATDTAPDVPMSFSYQRGQPLEMWLVDATANTSTPTAKLTTLPAALLKATTGWVQNEKQGIVIKSNGQDASFTEFVARAKSTGNVLSAELLP